MNASLEPSSLVISQPECLWTRLSHSSLRSSSAVDASSIVQSRPASPSASFSPDRSDGVDVAHEVAQPKSCTGCAAVECGMPGCSDAPIDSQCTDQCVVVPCNDATLDCHGDGSMQLCDDTSCALPTDCVDCDGLDKFLECCSDLHSYFADPRSVLASTDPPQSQQWDTFEAFLCGCGEMQPSAHDVQTRHIESLIRPSYVSSQLFMPGQSPSPISPQLEFQPVAGSMQFSRQPQDARQSASGRFSALHPTCRWDNCHAQFSTLPDLVAHVNNHHLQAPQAMPSDAVSCLWGDCTVHPDSPSSSQLDHALGSLSALTSHLLHDHLGLSVPDTVQTQSSSLHEPHKQHHHQTEELPEVEASCSPNVSSPSPTHSSHSLTPAPEPDSCTSVHCCQWTSCSHSFASCDELTAHINAEHVGGGRARYECFWAGCNRNGERGFISKQKICRHLQSHTGHRPFQCKVCEQYFSEAATLQQHMRRHTQEKPYQCDFPGCGKCFAITGALTIHKRTHNGLKPFKCTYCDRAFAESSNLAKHLRTHTGARPYACTHVGCGKCFARTDQLTRHAAIHKRKMVPNVTPVS